MDRRTDRHGFRILIWKHVGKKKKKKTQSSKLGVSCRSLYASPDDAGCIKKYTMCIAIDTQSSKLGVSCRSLYASPDDGGCIKKYTMCIAIDTLHLFGLMLFSYMLKPKESSR